METPDSPAAAPDVSTSSHYSKGGLGGGGDEGCHGLCGEHFQQLVFMTNAVYATTIKSFQPPLDVFHNSCQSLSPTKEGFLQRTTMLFVIGVAAATSPSLPPPPPPQARASGRSRTVGERPGA